MWLAEKIFGRKIQVVLLLDLYTRLGFLSLQRKQHNNEIKSEEKKSDLLYL